MDAVHHSLCADLCGESFWLLAWGSGSGSQIGSASLNEEMMQMTVMWVMKLGSTVCSLPGQPPEHFPALLGRVPALFF